MSHTPLQDRCRGVLLGLAAGDRNGGPIRMATLLAESLTHRPTFDPDDLLTRYVRWRNDDAFDTGPIAWDALARVASGQPVADAVADTHRAHNNLTAGCNPAHRAAPLAMSAPIPDLDLLSAARREAALTHHDPLAGHISALHTTLLRALIRGLPLPDALDHTSAHAPPHLTPLLHDLTPPTSRGGFAPVVFHAALHALRTQHTFPNTLRASLRFAGPANYTPVLTGALAGARWGASHIAPDLLAHTNPQLLQRVCNAADHLASLWTSPAA